MGWFDFLKRKKKKFFMPPYRYCVAVYSKAALRLGVLDDFLKKIMVIQEGKVVESYDYTDDVFESFSKVMPAYDKTRDVELENLPIFVKDDPSVVSYEVGEDYQPPL